MDTLLFVRPTESLTVFTQQVGRGLRLHEQKMHCAITDLIGNYRNVDVKLQLLAESPEDGGKKSAAAIPSAPAGCVLELETVVVCLRS
ncbi:hypothetical protein MO973_25085 [Paenibacillus sp. TRM 82003]|nr:hypothetical protein [Paenibacillus sp. TRM 82003]